MSCLAERNLAPEDWDVVLFLDLVADQFENVTPMSPDPLIVPRVDAWIAMAGVMGVPQSQQFKLIDQARALFRVVHGLVKIPNLHGYSAAELSPPDESEVLDGR